MLSGTKGHQTQPHCQAPKVTKLNLIVRHQGNQTQPHCQAPKVTNSTSLSGTKGNQTQLKDLTNMHMCIKFEVDATYDIPDIEAKVINVG